VPVFVTGWQLKESFWRPSRRTAMSRHNFQAGSGRTSLYDEITTRITSELEAGRVPWVQPWGTAAAKAPLAMPKNGATGRCYSGINVLTRIIHQS
jgi:antirestriction protein ArdC